MNLKEIEVEKPEDVNVIIGQSHFIKSAEDIYEAIVNTVPQAKFGLAFCEASADRLVRVEGNDEELKDIAAKNAMKIGAGHSFMVFLREAYPINVLRAIKQVPEVCRIFAATANKISVIVAENDTGRGILGVIDGQIPAGIENEEDVRKRREFLRKIGYKF